MSRILSIQTILYRINLELLKSFIYLGKICGHVQVLVCVCLPGPHSTNFLYFLLAIDAFVTQTKTNLVIQINNIINISSEIYSVFYSFKYILKFVSILPEIQNLFVNLLVSCEILINIKFIVRNYYKVYKPQHQMEAHYEEV